MSFEATSLARRRAAAPAALLLLASCSTGETADPIDASPIDRADARSVDRPADASSPGSGDPDAAPLAPDAAPRNATLLDQGENNWALMDGPVIQPDGSAARKQAELEEAEVEGRFDVGTAYLFRAFDSSSFTDIVLPVRNEGTDARCSIRADLVFKTAGGAQLAEFLTFLKGSSNGSSIACLQPGETGYISTLEEVDFDEVERVEIALSSSSFSVAGEGAALPFDYDVIGDELVVDVENSGVEEVEVRFAHSVLFDDDGIPTVGSIFGFTDDPPRIQPGETIELSGDVGFGLVEDGHTLWFATSFSAPDDTEAAAQSPRTAAERELRYRQKRAARAELARRDRAR